MKHTVCDLFGVDAPIAAFSHCRDVVAAVTRAGGLGVLGAVQFTPEELETELSWIDAQVGGRPYGVDLLMPSSQAGADSPVASLGDLVPAAHRDLVSDILTRYGVRPQDGGGGGEGGGTVEVGLSAERASSTRPERTAELIDVTFRHPVRALVSALGPPPPHVVERAHAAGMRVGALAGTRRHALRIAAAGVDFVVAQGGEAGGHTGEIGTMVLTPEVVEAVAPLPVLAAGGITTGRQIAAALTMGAAGVWTGSVWLATPEAETDPVIRRKIIEASAEDTVRTRTRSGKPARMLRSSWHQEWMAHSDVTPLPMPLQGMLTEEPFARIAAAAVAGEPGAVDLHTYFAGQGIGLMTSTAPAAEVFRRLMEETVDAIGRASSMLAE